MHAAKSDRRRFRTFPLAATVGAATALLAADARAVDRTFLPTTGGDWNTAANWSTGVVPTAADLAIFGNASGTVSLSAASTSLGLSFRQPAGTGPLTINGGGNALNVNAGAIVVGTATPAGQTDNVTFANVAVASAATNSFTIGVAATGGAALKFDGAGATFAAPTTATGTTTIGVANSVNNSFTVSNGAVVTTYNNFNVGGSGTVVNAGTSNNVVNVDNAQLLSLNGNRLLNLAAGTLNVSGNAVAIFGGGLDADAGVGGNASAINFSSGRISGRNSSFNFASNLPFTIGDGVVSGANGRAQYEMSSSTPTLVASDGILIRGDGTLAGVNSITGNVSGEAGAQVRPSVFGLPNDPADDRPWANLSVTGAHNNANVDIGIDVGSVPAAIAADTTPPFDPATELRIDRYLVNGAFTHGGTVTVDVGSYVAPDSGTYEVRIVGWSAGADVGAASSTVLSFVNGEALPTEYRADGIYVTLAPVPEPATLAAVAMGAAALLRRRRR